MNDEIVRIRVMCGAGASSTFVALRIRKAAEARQLNIEVSPMSEYNFELNLESTDVLLVGAHLSERYENISVLAAQAGAASLLMTEEMTTSLTGDAALDAALSTI